MSECVTQVWSRVTGFYRPVDDWNPGKKEELKDRKVYDKETVLEDTKEG